MAKKNFLATLIGFIFIFFTIIVIIFFIWWTRTTLPVDPLQKESKIFVIPKGWGVNEIGESLEREGLIKSKLAFKIMVTKEGFSKNLQAGDFRLSPSQNLFEIVQTLTHGTLDLWITIPEGWRREEVGQKIAEEFEEVGGKFALEEFLEKTKDEEGFLFPDTYLIPKEASVETIISIFRNNFEKKIGQEIKEETFSQGLTLRQAIILASLIEREAKHEADRPIVAGILLKRLKKGWKLQVDASVQYALANDQCPIANDQCGWWPKVSQNDLKIDSPYNTYKNLGLPPGPICNPGFSSIKAAVNPKETEYWFYLSDREGNIHYAKTDEEQEKNIEEYLK